eukprot:5845841-Amphidinium_carterae.1
MAQLMLELEGSQDRLKLQGSAKSPKLVSPEGCLLGGLTEPLMRSCPQGYCNFDPEEEFQHIEGSTRPTSAARQPAPPSVARPP